MSTVDIDSISSDKPEKQTGGIILDVLPPVFGYFCKYNHIPERDFIAFTLTKAPSSKYRKHYFYNYNIKKQYEVFSDQIKRWIKKVAKKHKLEIHYYVFFEYSRIHHCHGLLIFNGCDYPAWEAELKGQSKYICRISDIRKCYNKESWLKYMCKDFGRYPYHPIWD